MVEDNKNNDTKEELKTSSDGDDVDNQQTNENEDFQFLEPLVFHTQKARQCGTQP